MKLSKQKAMEGVGKAKLLHKAMVVKDPRFSRLHSDPRFQRAFKRKLKIPIDSRFSHVFSDKRFSDPLALDKRGRKIRKRSHKSSKKGNALHQYYHLHDSDDGDEASLAETVGHVRLGATNGNTPSAESRQNAVESGKTRQLGGPSPKRKAKREPVLNETAPGQDDITQTRSRFKSVSKENKPNTFDSEVQYAESIPEEHLDSDEGSVEDEDLEFEYGSEGSEGKDASEESSDTSSASFTSSEYSDDGEDIGDSPSEGAEEEKVPMTETETRRLALVNMDWEHIRAVDILAVMSSFLAKGGHIVSVSIFPSEFGLQQMKEEDQRGPQGLFQSEDGDDADEDAGDGVNMEKLRKYEKDKLRYYYAVVECDSIATADFLYQSCDGMEFERTSNTLDLRFIPDDMKFLNSARDVATEVPADYQAPLFETRALQHSKVKLTWDDDEPDRVKSLRQNFNAEQLNDMDFKAYLASDSEEGEDAEGDIENSHEDKAHSDYPETDKTGNGRKGARDKYRALLLGLEEAYEGKDLAKNDQDMEITFHSGLEELSKRLMDKNKQNHGDETVWEAYLRNKKEKKKLQKQTQHAQDDDEKSAAERRGGDDHNLMQADAGFDDPFFTSEGGVDIAAVEGTDSEREGVPVAKRKKSGRVFKKAEQEEKKHEEERSRAELELLFADEFGAGNNVKGYNLKRKRKGKRKEAETISEKFPTVNYDDPRFLALFTSHRFAIDPTEPEFKRSAAQLRTLLEKQQKRLPRVHEVVDSKKSESVDTEDVKVATSKRAKQELSSMVRSLKRKVGGTV